MVPDDSGVRLSLPEYVHVREVGMRDGLQLEPWVPTDGKLRMLDALVGTGVRRIEVTSFVSAKAVPALADADRIAASLGRWPEVRWSALALNLRGAQRAIDAGISEIEFVVSAGESHSRANSGSSTEAALEAFLAAVELVRDAGGRCELVVATAWDCPFDGPVPTERVLGLVRAAMAAEVDSICLADTIGTVTPLRLLHLVDAVTALASGRVPSLHLHNTYGAGPANVLAALQAGVDQLDASVGGLGGCPFAPGASGNIATEELVHLLHGCRVGTDIDEEAMLGAVRVTEQVLGRSLHSGPLLASTARAALP